MLTRSPCGILLKLIYLLEKKRGISINGKELLAIINNIQKKNPSFIIYNINMAQFNENSNELISIDFWNDINILENSGRIKIHQSEPLINITLTGILSANTLEISEKIGTIFRSRE